MAEHRRGVEGMGWAKVPEPGDRPPWYVRAGQALSRRLDDPPPWLIALQCTGLVVLAAAVGVSWAVVIHWLRS